MSREASGTPSIDLSVLLDVLPAYDLRSTWDSLRLCCAFSDTSGSGDGDGDEGDDGDDGDGDDGTGGATGDGKKPEVDIKDPEKKRLSDEAAAARVKARETQKALDAANARLQEIEDKDKTEVDLWKGKAETAEALSKTQAETIKSQAIRLAFFESGAAAQFRDPSVALSLLRDQLKDVEVDEDGEADADAIKKAAEELISKHAYLKAGDEGDDGSDDEGKKDPSGRETNGKRKSKDDLNAEALAKKFPALRR